MVTVSGKFFSGSELINTDVLVNSVYFLERITIYSIQANYEAKI
jgi:hypothetical protein